MKAWILKWLKARKDRKAKAWSRAWAIRTLGGGDFARYSFDSQNGRPWRQR